MNTTITTAGWYRANGKFFHAIDPKITGATFKDRGGNKPVLVAVFDPDYDDFRIKAFLSEKADTNFFEIDGRVFELTHIDSGLHAWNVDHKELWALLNGEPKESEPNDEETITKEVILKDYCIETHFDTSNRSGRNGHHPGNVHDFPEWMKAHAITISPEDTGGGAGHVLLITNLGYSHDFGDLCHGVRINGIWCTGMPLSRDGKACIMFSATPEELSEIRAYGDDVSDISIPNEIRPPRTAHHVRRLCLFLRDKCGKRNTDYSNWRDDITKVGYRIHGMCMADGQLSYWRRKLADLEKRKKHYVGLINRAYDRKAAAYKDYDRDEWMREVGGNPARWNRIKGDIEGGEAKCRNYIDQFETVLTKLRVEYEDAFARCEAREEKWAKAIEILHPKEN